MKILFIGDVVGKKGQAALKEFLPELKQTHRPQVTIINGENISDGRGISEKLYKWLLTMGANVVTLGNHAWDNYEIYQFIEKAQCLVRPINLPKGTQGQGITYLKVNQQKLAVINVLGSVFMNACIEPFTYLPELIEEVRKETPFIFIDFHAEVTSEKQAFGWYVDGRASAVVGTHTHTQTADERILPNGTAYITDVGMTGPYDSILGVEKETIINRFLTNLPARFEVDKKGTNQLNGCVITIDKNTGKATKIQRILINNDHPFLQ